MFCKNCGVEIEKSSQQCRNCGVSIETTARNDYLAFFSQLFVGRINRTQFILGLGGVLLSAFIVVGVVGLAEISGALLGLILVLSYAMLLPFSISLQVRRWHDLGFSGWMVLINFIPLISLIVLIGLIFLAGQKEKNKYGAIPTNRDSLKDVLLGKAQG